MLDRLSIFAEALDTTVEFILSGNKQEFDDDKLDTKMLSKFKELSVSDKKRIIAMMEVY